MLLFLDESYEKIDAARHRLAYAGFAIDERKYRGLVAAVYQAKQRFIIQTVSGMDDIQRIKLAHDFLIHDMAPERAEIKASKLLGSRQIKRLKEHGSAPGIALVDCLLDALREADATVFGILSTPTEIQDVLNPTDRLPNEHVRLLERVECWMAEQHADAMVVIIPDTLEHCKHNLSACLADFLFRSPAGKAMRHIVVTPFWVDSSVTVGAQLADLIVYILMNSMRPREMQIPLNNLWRKVSALEFRSSISEMRGIRTVNRKDEEGNQQAGADAH